MPLLAALAWGGLLRAQPPADLGGGPPGMPGVMNPSERRAFLLDVLASELGLDKTQRNKAEQLLEAARQSARPFREQLLSTRRAIREAVKNGAGASVLGHLHKQLAAGHLRLAEVETRAFVRLWLLLRTEQQSHADIAYELLGALILDAPDPAAPGLGWRMPPPPKPAPGERKP